jgi:hypothetical protein
MNWFNSTFFKTGEDIPFNLGIMRRLMAWSRKLKSEKNVREEKMSRMINIKNSEPMWILYDQRIDGRIDDTANIAGSRRVGSGDQNGKKMVDRREHQRFQVKKDAVAFIRSRRADPIRIKELSMGEIGLAVIRSNPSKLGRIKDLSISGLAFHYIDNRKAQAGEPFKLDILLADCGFYLENLSFEPISDFELDNDFSFNYIKTKRLGIKFKELTLNQVSKLKYLIRNYTLGTQPGLPLFCTKPS